MPFFRIIMRGHNFPGHPIGQPRERFGFYTTRWVQALNARRAQAKAVQLIWADPKLAIPDARRPEDRAWLTLEKVERIDRLPRFRGGGATWFQEDA